MLDWNALHTIKILAHSDIKPRFRGPGALRAPNMPLHAGNFMYCFRLRSNEVAAMDRDLIWSTHHAADPVRIAELVGKANILE